MLLQPLAASAQSNQFSGNFSLPSGLTAPNGGTVFSVRTNPLDEFTFNSRVAYSSTQVVIPAGQNSAAYALRLDNSPVVANKTIEFECVSGCDNIDSTTVGWWNAQNGVVGLANATEYLANSNRVINLAMQPADLFAGTVNFPNDFAATGTEQLVVEVRESSFAATAIFSQTLQPGQGSQSINFKLGVPSTATGGGWNIALRCINCNEDLAAGPYYPTSVNWAPSSLKSSSQFFFIRNRDNTAMTIDLISLSLPESNTAPIIGAISYLLLSD